MFISTAKFSLHVKCWNEGVPSQCMYLVFCRSPSQCILPMLMLQCWNLHCSLTSWLECLPAPISKSFHFNFHRIIHHILSSGLISRLLFVTISDPSKPFEGCSCWSANSQSCCYFPFQLNNSPFSPSFFVSSLCNHCNEFAAFVASSSTSGLEFLQPGERVVCYSAGYFDLNVFNLMAYNL